MLSEHFSHCLEKGRMEKAMALPTVVLLLWNLVKPTWAVNNAKYKVIPLDTDWDSAQEICLQSDHLLMPDLGRDELESMISKNIQTEEVFWMNGKSVEIMYPGQPVYLNFAYQSADAKLKSYLCHNELSRETKKNIGKEPLSWKAAQKVCSGTPKWTLYNVSSPKQVKGTVSLLKENITFWVDKVSKQKIPSMVSDEFNMKEECIGVMKLTDGSLDYRRDNCSNKHKFICVSDAEQFAPTITRMSKPFPFILEEPQPENYTTLGTNKNSSPSQDSGMSDGVVGGIVGGTVAGVILILVAAGGIYYLRRRWRSRKDYLRSLHRYTQRQASSGRLQGNASTGSLPGNSYYTDNKDSMKIAELEGYEDTEKRSYVQCQKDVVHDLKYRYAKYPSQGASSEHTKYSSQGSSAELEKLPGYHSMDGKKALQVLPAYETYDPDIGQLHQIQGYVNKQGHPQLSDLEQYDNVPRLPEKKGKLNALDELEQYENHAAENLKTGGQKVLSKPLGDTDRKTVCSLEELEQYENYKVPKRERGLFQLFKANKAKQAAEEARNKAKVKPDTLNDLEDYEGYELPTQKKVNKLEDLDAYENYAVKK